MPALRRSSPTVFLVPQSDVRQKQTECPELQSSHLKQITCVGVLNGTVPGPIWVYSLFYPAREPVQTCIQTGGGME